MSEASAHLLAARTRYAAARDAYRRAPNVAREVAARVDALLPALRRRIAECTPLLGEAQWSKEQEERLLHLVYAFDEVSRLVTAAASSEAAE